VEIAGHVLDGHNTSRATALGLAHIPGDRLGRGLVAGLSVRDNLLLRHQRRGELRRGPFLRREAVHNFVRRCIETYGIRAATQHVPTRTLSGGNQQRLLVARELELEPRVLVAVNPTRGLDVAATREVHQRLLAARSDGVAVLLISTDLDEILELADRVAVLYRGRLREVGASERTPETIGLLMGGVGVGA
jgi:simple sugar transport system ATP-binding protein